MSLFQCPPLPSDTAWAAESAFGTDHPYLQIGRSVHGFWHELDLAALEQHDQILANYFYPYSLATILQYWENLTDYQMSQASRVRVDMKYALRLPLKHPGIESLALCAFRQHVSATQAGKDTFQKLLDCVGKLSAQAKPVNTDQVIASICSLDRAENIVEHMSIAIEAIAINHPGWLITNALPHWYERYHHVYEGQQTKYSHSDVTSVGKDGQYLLHAIENTNATYCGSLPEIQRLQLEWRAQFKQLNGEMQLRDLDCSTCVRKIVAF